MPTIDNLDIQISATAEKANKSIEKLVEQLDKLSGSLGKFNGSGLQGLANGVQRLSTAMQGMNNVKTADFTRLANNITKLGNIPVANLNSAASSMSHLTRAFNNLGTVSANAQQVGVLASNLSKLGYKSIQNAVQNIPHLATALNQLMVTLSNAPTVNQNIINMTNALANLASQSGKVGTAANTLSGQLNKYSSSVNTASKSTRNFSTILGNLYAIYSLIKRGAKALYNSIDSTSDYIEAFNYYNVAFDKVASDWSQDYEKYGYENAEAYAESFTDRMNDSLGKLSGIKFDEKGMRLVSTEVKNLGLNIQEVTQFAAQLASVTNSVGLTGEASLAAADSFTKLAGDISSLFNVDYKTVSQNLQSGLIGQSRALYKYGIDITNATLQTYAYNLGLSKTVTEMTQAEKMQLRMLAILDQSRVSWGDLANTINQPANAMRVLKAQVSELSQLFGQLFIPVLNKVIPVLTGITIALKRLVSAIAGFFGIEIDFNKAPQGFNEMENEAEDLADGLDNVASSAKKAKAGLRGFDELKTINMPDTTSMGDVGDAGDMLDLTDEILKATEEYEKVWQEAYDRMQNVAEQWADKIEEVFQPVKEFFQNLINGNWAAAGKNFSDIISGIFNTLANAIASVDWEYVGTAIGEFIRGIDWFDIFSSIGRFIWEALTAGIELYKGIFNAAPIETIIMTAIGVLGFTPLGKLVAGKIIGAITKHLTFGKIGEMLGNSLFTSISTAYTSLGGISGILTMDWATLAAAGTATEIGLTIAVGLIGGIAAAIGGWNIGKLINNALYDAGIVDVKNDKSFLGYLAEIKSGFEDGSWKGALQLWGKDISDGFKFIWEETDSIWANGWVSLLAKNEQGLADTKEDWLQGWAVILSENIKWKQIEDGWNDGWNKIIGYTKVGWGNTKESFYQGWLEITNWWNKSAISKWWNEDVAPWFTKEKWVNVMSGIKLGFETSWNDAINSIKAIWNNFAKWLNSKLNFDIPSFTNPFTGTVYGGTTIKLGKIPTFATGGFPEDGLFMANHTELVGKFDNGKTAVANNEQIISGISSGVKQAVSEALIPYLADIAQNTRDTADKEYGISSDALFKSVQKSAQNYSKRTGRLAFSG